MGIEFEPTTYAVVETYKGYTIEMEYRGMSEQITVNINGDDCYFDAIEEARKAIDELPDDYKIKGEQYE